MRIAYCTNVRLPSERAHGHQVARVCDALVKLGHEVTIFAPFRKNPIKDDYRTFHGADRKVKLTCLGDFDPIDRWFLPKFLQLFLLNRTFRRNLRRELSPERFDLLYTRTPALLPTLLEMGVPVIVELHTLPRRGKMAFVQHCNRCALVVCLTTPMRDELVSWGIPREKIIVESDAVDMNRFRDTEPLSFVEGHLLHPRIGYAGQIESMGLSKGIPQLLDALAILKRKGVVFSGVIAGPSPRNEALLSQIINTVGAEGYFGFLPWHLIPHFLVSCDVLVYPAPASHHPFYMRDTSPLKIFEYMAAGKPIVTADLPPIRDILDEETAYFCTPGDPKSIADAIERVLANPKEAEAKAERAKKKVREHTWEKRMNRILQAFHTHHPS